MLAFPENLRVRFWGIACRHAQTPHLARFARTVKRTLVVGVLSAAFVTQSPGASLGETRRILVINDLNIVSSPGFNEVDRGIVAELRKSPYQIELYYESLDITLFSDDASQRQFREGLIRRYLSHKPDVVIAAGQASVALMMDLQPTYFQNTPVIFCVVLGEAPKLDSGMAFTGVVGKLYPAETLRAALQLLPDTQHVFVVGGIGKFDVGFEAIAKRDFQSYESKLDFTYLTNLTMPALLDSLRHLPSHSIVYHTAITEDATGNHFIDSVQSVPMVVSAANAPVFVMDDVNLREGTVGGDLENWREDGRVAAGMAVRVLNGEKPKDIPIVTARGSYMFDWRALKRWGLKESNLPPGSTVLNRQPTPWELYRRYIIGGICLIVLEAFLIFGLVLNRRKRRKAENELEFTHERLRLAVEAGKCVGWDWDVKSGQDRWFGDLQTMFGISAETFSGGIEDFRRRVYPDDRELVSKAIADARLNRKPYVAEFRVIREDQSVRWITARGKFFYGAKGEAERMLGMAVDITERKEIEQQARESERRFRLVANTAPVMIWMSGPDKKCTYVNQPWLEFTGRDLEAELGDGWAAGIMPEDLKFCLDTYNAAFDRREVFRMEYRFRNKHGEYRWLFDMGVPRFSADGSFAGYIGSCLDVTERREAVEALANLSGRLIQAQEEERRRIAREIHDDYQQRLAMIAIDLEDIAQNSSIDTSARLHELWNRVSELGGDLHSLSHRLHSSTLERLGLIEGVRAFCEEFAEQQEIQVDFRHHNIPRNVPEDLALCLFRVVQEGLRNVKRHSGVHRAEVRLELLGDKLHVSVSDQGKGFELGQDSSEAGIGIHSMEERLRVLGGRLEIHSKLMKGTRLDAWLPYGVMVQRAG